MTLYLPQHIAFLTNRAWFYYNGDENAKLVVKSVTEGAVITSSTRLVQNAKETILAAGSTLAGMGGVSKEL